jgi:hypothetical protein
LLGQFEVRVERLNARIVPVPNLAGENIGIHIPAQLQRSFHFRQVVGQNDDACRGRNQVAPGFCLGDLRIA